MDCCIGITNTWSYTGTCLTRKRILSDEAITLIFLGPPQSGKSKFLQSFSEFDFIRTFPSVANELEEAKGSFDYLGRKIQLKLLSTSDSTTKQLLSAYINKADVIILMYDCRKLEHLVILDEKYVPLIGTHRSNSEVIVFLIGTTALNNPYAGKPNGFVFEVGRRAALFYLIRRLRTLYGIDCRPCDCIVDNYQSTNETKGEILGSILSGP